MGCKGTKYVSGILRNNTVNRTRHYFSVYIYIIQTLTDLHLNRCNIGDLGMKYLADALINNKVIVH